MQSLPDTINHVTLHSDDWWRCITIVCFRMFVCFYHQQFPRSTRHGFQSQPDTIHHVKNSQTIVSISDLSSWNSYFLLLKSLICSLFKQHQWQSHLRSVQQVMSPNGRRRGRDGQPWLASMASAYGVLMNQKNQKGLRAGWKYWSSDIDMGTHESRARCWVPYGGLQLRNGQWLIMELRKLYETAGKWLWKPQVIPDH